MSPLVDLTDVDFDAPLEGAGVTESVKHILDDLERAVGTISGWSSFLDKEDI